MWVLRNKTKSCLSYSLFFPETARNFRGHFMPLLFRFLTLAKYFGVGVRRGSRIRYILHSPFTGAAIWFSFVLVYVGLSFFAFSHGQSSIIHHCTVFSMLLVQPAPLQGYVLLQLCKPQYHCWFPTAQYVSLCNLASLELLYSMQKKSISLSKCLCVKHYKFKLGVHGLTRDNPGLSQCKVSKDFPLLAKNMVSE